MWIEKEGTIEYQEILLPRIGGYSTYGEAHVCFESIQLEREDGTIFSLFVSTHDCFIFTNVLCNRSMAATSAKFETLIHSIISLKDKGFIFTENLTQLAEEF